MERREYIKQIDEVIANGRYKADWDSIKGMEAPKWYRRAKFGIFVHWGVYSVPGFNNEWYPRNMYIQSTEEYLHHVRTYGPHKKFGYKDFIPMFKAENFDADEWMELFAKAGAKYVMPVAEHHDGFQMYKSQLSKFNSCSMGPKRDVLAEIFYAAEKRGIVPCASSHRIEHWFFMGHGKDFDSDIREPLAMEDFYWPAMPEPENLFDISAEISEPFMEDWLLRCCELVDNYRPRILYFDWWIQTTVLKPYLKKFAAYYYNRGIEWGMPVAINYKYDAFPYGCAVRDVERGQFADIKPDLWQSCTSMARNSWCYTEQNIFKTSREIVCELIDVVSKNGSLLLNVGPKADGSICSEERKILGEIGGWLDVNKEAIFDADHYKIFGEGPVEINEGQFADAISKEFTKDDIRFTCSGAVIYAHCLNFPDDGVISIKTLALKSRHFNARIKKIAVLGYDAQPEFNRTESELQIKVSDIKTSMPLVFKIETE